MLDPMGWGRPCLKIQSDWNVTERLHTWNFFIGHTQSFPHRVAENVRGKCPFTEAVIHNFKEL